MTILRRLCWEPCIINALEGSQACRKFFDEVYTHLSPEELEEIQKDLAYTMIRRKTFDDARVLKKWQIIIDSTELDEGYQNQIPFGAFDVNLIYYKEKKVLGDKEK